MSKFSAHRFTVPKPCVTAAQRRHAGFTLIEMLVVLVIIAALMGVILTPLSTQVRMRQMREEDRNLQRIEEALLGFAQSNGYLPCPDTDQDGAADYDDGAGGAGVAGNDDCLQWRVGEDGTRGFGLLPIADLGLPPTDRWGRRHYYRVDQEFVHQTQVGGLEDPDNNPNNRLDLGDPGVLSITDRTDLRTGLSAENVAVVVFSTGPTGYCGYDGAGNQISHGLDSAGACPPADAPWTDSDEGQNLKDTATEFFNRTATDGTSTCGDDDATKDFCHYDDQLIWLPAAVIKTKLIDAGRLP